MQNKSYWIWHYGDYEIFHTMNLHLRREERGCYRPAFWKIPTPYLSVKFKKDIYCESGYLVCHTNGNGCIIVDGKRHRPKMRIELSSGYHAIEIQVTNLGGLPAAFVESDVCPSDESWVCNHFAGEFTMVGYNPCFCQADQNPEEFPFEYKNVLPIAREQTDEGILYDFGTELFGYLNITTDTEKEIEVFYGESAEEALDTDYSYITDLVYGSKNYRLPQRAFRYIYLKGISYDVNISADYEYLPLKAEGSFNCDNSLFNDIYRIASYTFHLNCREAFLDGIKRDRWVWSGDAYQSTLINRYLFADKDIEQRTLLGLIGKEPIEQHINTILDYSLLWIINLYEHYMTYGDKTFLRRIYPMAKKLIAFCETRLNENGFIEGNSEDWTFIDWSPIEKIGAVCAEQMLLARSYCVMSYLSKILEDEKQNEFSEKSEILKQRINKYYWNKEKGAFIDSYQSGNANVTRHANIFAIMYDIADETQVQSIIKNVLKNSSITKITTPYFEGYELDVLAKLGDFTAVEDMITSYWGGMIKLGANTIWEEYNPNATGNEHYDMYGEKYHKSLCHAWGAGPIYLFGRYYLGVYPTCPGYDTFTVEPTLGNLKEICGTVPINNATVTIELNQKQLSVTATKAGGTLIWKNKSYNLVPNETILIKQ